MSRGRTPDPCAIVVFGGSGDLTSKKLMPALHNLQVEGHIPQETSIVGSSRTEWTDEEFCKDVRGDIEEHSRIQPSDESWAEFSKGVHYVAGNVNDAEAFTRLGRRLEEIDQERGTAGNRVWYLATLPSLFGTIAEQIGKSGLLDTGGWHRLVVEKPFGQDLASAHELNAVIKSHFSEDQIFRIDHFLGKETVQNLLVFRFANAIFEPIWNRRYIDSVQISTLESFGIEERGAFYERTGALRDVGQNHLLQLLALIAMEPPASWDADAIRDEKRQLLRAVRRWSASECPEIAVRGQYEGYRGKSKVDKNSSTETFFAMKVLIDNWRWADVPFYLRTGKKLATSATEIAITFQRVPHLLFKKTAVEELERNQILIRIQPHEGISLKFGTKVPGPDVNVLTVDMEFDYEAGFGSGTPEAYERLLLDCMLGDQTLFARSDEIEEAWEIVDPIVGYWAEGGRPGGYAPGSWGPASADELLRRDGRRWKDPSR